MPRTPSSSQAAAPHNNGRFWSAAEDDLLIHTLNRTPLHHGRWRDWKAIADVFVSAGFDRTPVMLRNREMRISKNKHPFGGRRNRCKACGEIRAGHTCRVKAMANGGDVGFFLPPPEPCEPCEP